MLCCRRRRHETSHEVRHVALLASRRFHVVYAFVVGVLVIQLWQVQDKMFLARWDSNTLPQLAYVRVCTAGPWDNRVDALCGRCNSQPRPVTAIACVGYMYSSRLAPRRSSQSASQPAQSAQPSTGSYSVHAASARIPPHRQNTSL